MPKISVIMPAYNAEKYIAEAIESILSQTFTDFEFIIIDDGSTDETAEIIKSYRDSRILYLKNQQNLGIVDTLNKGLDLCQGEYIARMDSDDIALPLRFEKQVKYLDNHPEIGLLGTAIHKFGYLNEDAYPISNKNLLKCSLLDGMQMVHPSWMMRKALIQNNSIRYKKEYEYVEDYKFLTELCQCSEICNLSEILLNYRMHETQISSVKNETQKLISDKIRMEFLEKTGISLTERQKAEFLENNTEKANLDALENLLSLALKENEKNGFFHSQTLETFFADKLFYIWYSKIKSGKTYSFIKTKSPIMKKSQFLSLKTKLKASVYILKNRLHL